MGIPVTADHFAASVRFVPTGAADPREVYVNTFYFRNDDAPTVNPAPSIRARLEAFYGQSDDEAAISHFMGNWLANNPELRVYDLGQAEPREPDISNLAITVGSAAVALASEVACRCSIRASTAPPTAPSATNPKVRAHKRTGGVYIGPLGQLASEVTANGRQQLSAAFMTAVSNAAEALATVSVVHPVRWVLLSPTTGDSWVVDNGFVDSDFDTIRRRGIENPTRITWAL